MGTCAYFPNFPNFQDDHVLNCFKLPCCFSTSQKVFNHLHEYLLRCLLKTHFPGLHFRLTESEYLREGSSQIQRTLFSLFATAPSLMTSLEKFSCVSGVSLDVPISKNISFHPRLKVKCSSFMFPLSSLVFSTLYALISLCLYL